MIAFIKETKEINYSVKNVIYKEEDIVDYIYFIKEGEV
jgi:hypothetical protein